LCGPTAEHDPSSSEKEDVLLRKIVPILAMALALMACTSSAGTTTAPPETTTTTAPASTTPTTDPGNFPVTVEGPNGAVEIAARPQAIVSLSPTATEMLFAIGAGDQVVAVDSLSNFPADAPLTDLAAFTPSTEAIASYRPDLVVVSFDANELLAGLGELEIPTLLLGAATTIDDVYAQIGLLGVATGHEEEATAVTQQIAADIEQIASTTPQPIEPLTYYYELEPTFFSVTSATFVGTVLATIGLENIADPEDADSAAFGYPQLSSEFIVAADPDLVLLADTKCCEQTAETVAARPGWAGLSAVLDGGVVELDDDIASRWGPRIIDLLEAVAARVGELTAP
jgi:iron complex transport system substrate-binding protein